MHNPKKTSFNQLSLPYLRAFIGLVFIGLSLFATISFLSQGFTGLTFLGIVAFCVGIECVKVLFSGDIGFYLALKQSEKALFSFVIVAILFCLSIGSETWLLMNGHLQDTAKLESVTGRSAALQSQLAAKQAQLAACNPNYLSKCVNPRTAELQALQSESDKILQAESSQAQTIANQKFWQQIATATGASVDNLQLGLNLLRSFLAELIGLFLLAQFSTFKRLQNYTENDLNPDYSLDSAMRNPEPLQHDNSALQAEIERLRAELEKKQ